MRTVASRLLAACASVLIAFVSGPAHGADESGGAVGGAGGGIGSSGWWLLACTANEGYCDSFVEGVNEVIFYSVAHRFVKSDLGEDIRGCRPPEVTNGQSVTIWLQYLQNHPEHHELTAITTYSAAMREAFPCR
jgi:hypothetical protein